MSPPSPLATKKNAPVAKAPAADTSPSAAQAAATPPAKKPAPKAKAAATKKSPQPADAQATLPKKGGQLAHPAKSARRTEAAKPAKPAKPNPTKAARTSAKTSVGTVVQASRGGKPTKASGVKPELASAGKPATKKSVKPTVTDASVRPKLVRDSFTMPKGEYAVLETLKRRAAQADLPSKKSELLRAGLKALASMGDAAFAVALQQVPSLKTGRPGGKKKAG